MPTPRSPDDLLTGELKEIYSAERQLTRAIARLSRRVHNAHLRQCLDTRTQQGERLIDELDQAFDDLDVSKGRPKNLAAEGLIEDIDQHIEEIEDEKLIEPALVSGLQKLEHYCMAAWGSARSMSRLLGEERVMQSMERALSEGRALDEELTRLAEDEINPAMLQGDGGPPHGGGSRRPSPGADAPRR